MLIARSGAEGDLRDDEIGKFSPVPAAGAKSEIPHTEKAPSWERCLQNLLKESGTENREDREGKFSGSTQTAFCPLPVFSSSCSTIS